MSSKTIIVVGGGNSVDRENLKRAAQQSKTIRWSCPVKTLEGDTILLYAQRRGNPDIPEGGIIAVAIAMRDAERGGSWKARTLLGDIRILETPFTRSSILDLFPGWGWARQPQSNVYLTGENADKAPKLLAALSVKENLPASLEPSRSSMGAGFGDPEQNRAVELAACGFVTEHFVGRGYAVATREREKIGYDFDVEGHGEMLHVEVKGVRGLAPQFPITAKELRCAEKDSAFRLAVVTDALGTNPKLHLLTGAEFIQSYLCEPLAYMARLV